MLVSGKSYPEPVLDGTVMQETGTGRGDEGEEWKSWQMFHVCHFSVVNALLWHGPL